MKRFAVVLVVVVGLMLAGCPASPTGPTGPALKIGVAGAHTGSLAEFGIPTLRAVEMAANDLNATVGLLGQPVEVVSGDDECDPATGADVAAQLVSEGVIAVIGHTCSGATGSALPIYEAADIALISSSATSDVLSEYANFFRTIQGDRIPAELMVEYAATALSATTLSVVHDGDSYSQSIVTYLTETIAATAGVVLANTYEILAGGTNNAAIVSSVIGDAADVVLYSGYAAEGAPFVVALVGASSIPVVASATAHDSDFITGTSGFWTDVYVVGQRSDPDNSMTQSVLQDHLSTYGEDAGPFYLNAYAAAQCLFAAIEATGSDDPTVIGTWLQANSVNTALGQITFDESGEAFGNEMGYAAHEIAGSQFVEVP